MGERPSNVDSDHPNGNAVDVMIPDYSAPACVALGDAIAQWLVANRKKLGVKYVIWNDADLVGVPGRRGLADCGTAAGSCYNGPSDTASHRDHVHVSTYGDSAGAAPVAGPRVGPAVLPLASFTLTARFGQCGSMWARCHTGLDFSAGTGQPIRAVLGGRVVASGTVPARTGG